jgi:CheY-like chemotaxis protein
MKKTWIPQVVVIIMLLWALNPDNPYGYYILLRWVCCGIFIYLAIQALEEEKQSWVWVFGITALVYNPIFRVRLNRELWSIINLVTIVIAVASIFVSKVKKTDKGRNIQYNEINNSGKIENENKRSEVSPLKKEPPPVVLENNASKSEPLKLKSSRVKEVLIVDDEEPFLLSLADGLSVYRKYFNLRTAPNGAEAVKILKLSPIDLVITDLSMPKMDGFELLAYMIRNYPKIPVILMTAYGTPKIEEIVIKMGVFRYMEKPMTLNELADNIFAALRIKTIKADSKKAKMEISENQKKNILEYVDSTDNLVKGLYHPAILFADQGRYNEAIFCLRELLERSTDMQEKVKYLYSLGQIMEQMNEFEDAISYYKEASALCIVDSDISYWIHNNIGFSLCMLGRFIEAEKYCRLAIGIDLSYSNAFKNLGLSLEGQGKLRESIDAYITATENNAKDVRALNLFEKLLNKHPNLKDEYNESLNKCRSIVEKAFQHYEKPKQLH